MSKQSRRDKQALKRRKDKHHLIPRSRNGHKVPSNLLLIKISRHRNWHAIWGNKTLNEIIELLQRVRRAKNAQQL